METTDTQLFAPQSLQPTLGNFGELLSHGSTIKDCQLEKAGQFNSPGGQKATAESAVKKLKGPASQKEGIQPPPVKNNKKKKNLTAKKNQKKENFQKIIPVIKLSASAAPAPIPYQPPTPPAAPAIQSSPTFPLSSSNTTTKATPLPLVRQFKLLHSLSSLNSDLVATLVDIASKP